jgi:WXG100 family type VII secretion target
MSDLVSPEELEDLARSHEQRAAELRQHARTLGLDVENTRWEGPAANRFHHDSKGWESEVHRTADELDESAAELRRVANTIRAELQELARLEAAVRKAVGSGVGHAHRNFPASGDPQWQSLARELGLK